MKLFNSLTSNIKNLNVYPSQIDVNRKAILNELAGYIGRKIKSGEKVNLIFICTHNSRRSIMSQIWASTAAAYFNIPDVYCYSGGTETTAFNQRAVDTVSNFGFKVAKQNSSVNPLYLVHYSDNDKPVECFSKIYSDKSNPQNNFAAIMTCSDADANCPVILGAEVRFLLTYNDPKEFDNTKLEVIKYKERFIQIGREMFFIFERVSLMF